MKKVFPSITVLIPGIKSGDENAWNDFCQNFRVGLTSKSRGLCRSCGTANVNADDLVQETLMKAWKGRETFRGETTSQFAKWLLSILRNTFFDACRKQNLEAPISTWMGISDQADTPSANAISFQEQADFLACLAELKPKYQEVIDLRAFEGMKFIEISERLGLNIHTVASNYRRGIEQLSNLLMERAGIERTTAMFAAATKEV